MNDVKNIEELLKQLRERKTELDRCQGELDAVLKEFSQTYNTESLDKLKRIQEDMESKLIETEKNLKKQLNHFYEEIENNGIL